MIELYLTRKTKTDNSTIGELETRNGFQCYTLENLPHDPKIDGNTRIMAGRYPVKFRKVLSAKTAHYRKKFPWFTWHLELQDVPNFKYVYIHIGNFAKDTDGCILVGTTHLKGKNYISDSTTAFTELYSVLQDELEKGGEVWINIVDDDKED